MVPENDTLKVDSLAPPTPTTPYIRTVRNQTQRGNRVPENTMMQANASQGTLTGVLPRRAIQLEVSSDSGDDNDTGEKKDKTPKTLKAIPKKKKKMVRVNTMSFDMSDEEDNEKK